MQKLLPLHGLQPAGALDNNGSDMPYWQALKALYGSNLVVMWPMITDLSGTIAVEKVSNLNGTYHNATLGNVSGPGGKGLAPLFGANTGINVFSAGLSAAFPYLEGTFGLWINARAGSWAAGLTTYLALFQADINNRIMIRQSTLGNRLDCYYYANSINKAVPIINLHAVNSWLLIQMSWSVIGDFLKVWINGRPYSGNTVNGLGAWAGTLASAVTVLGSSNSTTWASSWPDWLGGAWLLNRPIASDTEALAALTASGLRSLVVSILGDSIENDPSDWPTVAMRTYNGSCNYLLNHAVAGNSIVTDMANQTTAALADNGNRYICALGTNDNNAGDMTVLRGIVETELVRYRNNNPNAQLYYMNVLPRWTDNTGAVEVDKSNIRTAISVACANVGVTCWDTYTDPWITAADTTDGVHPSATVGSPKVAAKILTLLS